MDTNDSLRIAASMVGATIVAVERDGGGISIQLDDGRTVEFISWWDTANDEGGMEISADPKT